MEFEMTGGLQNTSMKGRRLTQCAKPVHGGLLVTLKATAEVDNITGWDGASGAPSDLHTMRRNA